MDILGISNLCNENYTISDLSVSVVTGDKINKKTIRGKGQLLTQRFMYFTGGTTSFVLSDATVITACAGDLLYLPPDVTYTSYWEDDPNNGFIAVFFNISHKDKNYLLHNTMALIKHEDYNPYHNAFHNLAHYFQHGRLGYRLKCHSILLDIIFSLVPHLVQFSPHASTSKIQKGILYIEDHYMEKINVNAIASMCSMCPSAFRKQFRLTMGMSPIEYKNYLIAKKTAVLLTSGDMNTSEVAAAVGIDDIFYFNRMFKKYFHLPPGQYRQEQIAKKEQRIL